VKRGAVALLLCVSACVPADFDYANGTSGRYADWQGRWVVVNYWAEWCAPCRAEIPELNGLDDMLDGHGVLVVGVNYDGLRGPALGAVMQRMGIEFPVIDEDPRVHFGYEQPSVLPTTVVINPKGAVVATLVGPQTRKTLENLLGIIAPM
jgi:thiol-disulfide isomerase/thioredoxin